MSTVAVFEFTKETLERRYDEVKVLILGALVQEGLLEEDIADKWCETHTLIMKRKGIFRTISDKWKKRPVEESQHYTHIVMSPESVKRISAKEGVG